MNVNNFKNNNYVDLFLNISQRLRNENNLSDLTFAVTQVVPEFGYDILKFFGFNIESSDFLKIEREYYMDDCRIDFAFHYSSPIKSFLLENKIYDKDYHIKEYTNVFKKQMIKFGIISNHILSPSAEKCAKENNWVIRYWGELINFTEGQIDKYGEFQSLMQGFIRYLKEVCDMKPIEQIRFDYQSLHSLFYLNNLIGKIINSSTHEQFEYRRIREACGISWSGYLYSIKNTISNKEIRSWFGVDFKEDGLISIQLHDKWNMHLNLNSELRKFFFYNHNSQNDYFNFIDREWKVSFAFTPEQQNLFMEFNSDEQEQRLREFFKKVNEIIESKL